MLEPGKTGVSLHLRPSVRLQGACAHIYVQTCLRRGGLWGPGGGDTPPETALSPEWEDREAGAEVTDAVCSSGVCDT